MESKGFKPYLKITEVRQFNNLVKKKEEKTVDKYINMCILNYLGTKMLNVLDYLVLLH